MGFGVEVTLGSKKRLNLVWEEALSPERFRNPNTDPVRSQSPRTPLPWIICYAAAEGNPWQDVPEPLQCLVVTGNESYRFTDPIPTRRPATNQRLRQGQSRAAVGRGMRSVFRLSSQTKSISSWINSDTTLVSVRGAYSLLYYIYTNSIIIPFVLVHLALIPVILFFVPYLLLRPFSD